MKIPIIVLAILVVAGIACASEANSQKNDIRTVPIQEKDWPKEEEISREVQDEIRRQAPGGRQDIVVGGKETRGKVITGFAGLTIELPADVESMGVVVTSMCKEGHTCLEPPYMTLTRGGGSRAYIAKDGRIIDAEGRFGDVKISR